MAAAADIDPTTVATMAVVGATTVFGLSWLTLLMFPVLAVVQMISARVGVVTGCDLQVCVRRRRGRPSQLLLLGSVLVVAVITIAADLEGGAAALGLLFHVNWHWFVVPLALVLFGMLALGTYDEMQRVLRYALVCLLAYVVSAFLGAVPWHQVARATFIPHFQLSHDYTSGALALMGTSLTSYVYVWQTIEESEEQPPYEWLRAEEAGASLGILFGVAVFWFILVSTGATLGLHHRAVDSAQQAAEALRPVAGPLAGTVFAVGLLASAVVALPVLMATCAYLVGSSFDWERGLSEKVRAAPRFYAVLAGALALGLALTLTGASPIRILFFASIAGGLGTPISMVFLMLVAGDPELMGDRAVGRGLKAAGWGVAGLVIAASGAFLVQLALSASA